MNTTPRVLAGAVCLCIGGFCVFGFRAANEFAWVADRWPWQTGFGTVGLLSATGAGFCFGGDKLAAPRNRARLAGSCAGMIAGLCAGLLLQRFGHDLLALGIGVVMGILVTIFAIQRLSRDASKPPL